MTAQLLGGTKEMIDGMFAQLAGPQRSAQGFILHANGPVAGGWRVDRGLGLAERLRSVVRELRQAGVSRGRPLTVDRVDELNEVLPAG
jgi:hypothetical protein